MSTADLSESEQGIKMRGCSCPQIPHKEYVFLPLCPSQFHEYIEEKAIKKAPFRVPLSENLTALTSVSNDMTPVFDIKPYRTGGNRKDKEQRNTPDHPVAAR